MKIKYSLIVPFICFFLIVTSFSRKPPVDESVKISSEQENGKIVYYGSNSNYCPYTVEIKFPKLKNLKASVKLPFVTVIQPQTEKVKLFELTPKPNAATSYSISMGYSQGDFDTKPNDDVVYQLPYEEGTSQRIDQGYGGKFSHNSKGREYALDFGMDVGTKVMAARDGVVIDTRSSDSKGGPNPALSVYGNFVTIYHEDGTFANYYHLKKNGVKVKKGDKVKAGEWIG